MTVIFQRLNKRKLHFLFVIFVFIVFVICLFSRLNVFENIQNSQIKAQVGKISYQVSMENLPENSSKAEITKINDGSEMVGSRNTPFSEYNAEIYRKAMCNLRGDYTFAAVNCICKKDYICWLNSVPKMILNLFGTIVDDLFNYQWM